MSKGKERALKAAKAARGGGNFLPIPADVLTSPALASLSPYACKLLFDIASQWRLGHNGDMGASFEKVMRPRGWKSKDTLFKALKELCESGLINLTRQGGMHQCSLFALGWLAIDECGGKLDVKATTAPLNLWREPIKPLENKLPSTPHVPKPLKKADLGTPNVLAE